MARRSDHTREELKALAIKAGHQLIGEKGFSKFSAREVASRIGYTVGTLYHVFETYDNLMLCINAKTLDTWYETMRCALIKHKGSKILFLAKFYITYSRAHYHHWLALFEHHMEHGRSIPSWYTHKMMRFFTLVEDALMPLLRQRTTAKRAAKVLWAGIHGISILAHTGKLAIVGSDSAERLAHSLVESYLKGLREKHGQGAQ